MSRPHEHWFLCGGVDHPDAPEDAVRLSASGPEKNISVDIGGICEKLTGQLTPEFRDLLLIASYVQAADAAVLRGDRREPDLNENWHRHFHFAMGVDRPDFWSAPRMKELLEQTLGFLSDDSYAFEFLPAKEVAREQLAFTANDGAPFLSWDHIDEIALFSGGLDSLAGAAQLVLAEKKNVILVSHRSATKIWKVQRELVADLRRLSPTWGPDHVAINVVKHRADLRVERTQRSRSFLYAAIAGAVAHLVERDRVLLFENGVIGLNLPVSRQVIGANATRTAHPRVLRGFSRILGAAAGRRLTVENPFVLKTRSEVLQVLAFSGAAELIRHSVSCAHVADRNNQHPHCGVCSQCIDRRFSILAAGLESHDPEEGYEVDLVAGERKSQDDRTLLLEYIDTADRFAAARNVDDFLAKCGEANRAIPSLMESLGIDADTAGRELFGLHKRHGQAVALALQQIMAWSAQSVRDGELPATSLPILLYLKGLAAANRPSSVAPEPPTSPVLNGGDYLLRNDGAMWTLRFRGGRPFPMKPNKGLEYLRTLLQRPGETMTAFALVDVSEGREVSSHPLATSLGVDAQTRRSVQAELNKLKSARDEAAEFCDDEAVSRCEEEMEKLAAYLRGATGPGGKVRRETVDQKRARTAVSNAIKRVIDKIARADPRMAAHLDEQVQRGFYLTYRETSIPWET